MKTKVETNLELWWEFVDRFEVSLLSRVVEHDVFECSALLRDLMAAE
jgi:hypothetical protein